MKSQNSSTAAQAEEEDIENTVLYEKVDRHIARVTLNRPERGNAVISPQMNEELLRKMALGHNDDEIKVIIIAGNGRHFCVGEDVRRFPIESFGLKKGQRLPQSIRMKGISDMLDQTLRTFIYGPKLTIAAVQGAALGAGFQIPLLCDIVVAADDAYFARRQTRIGFGTFDFFLPIVLLRLGINRGYEALATGRSLSAEELKGWGFVSSVVPRDDLDAEAERYAKAIAAHSTDGLAIGRQALHMFWNQMGMSNWWTFIKVAHPLFTNIVWRDDEFNLIRERNATGNKDAMARLHKIWGDLGFE